MVVYNFPVTHTTICVLIHTMPHVVVKSEKKCSKKLEIRPKINSKIMVDVPVFVVAPEIVV